MTALGLGVGHHSVVTVAALLWDFGDTLVDERWMARLPDGWPGWAEAWVEVVDARADDWHVGAVTAREIFAVLAELTGMTSDAVRVHARECCQLLAFHETAWRVATERRLPQALVTVNSDLFAEFVVPAYDLATVFDVIVMSFAERTVDKPSLCDIVLDRLGFEGNRSEALLIDNRPDLVEAWREVGGTAYWFESDTKFARDLPRLLG